MTIPTPTRCRNCGNRPSFVKSDDPAYSVKLQHVSATCPAAFGLVHYNSTKRNATEIWNKHNKAKS